MIKKKRSFLLLEVLFAMVLFLSILPFIFRQFSQQRLRLEEKITNLQIERIKEESLFLIEQDIKSILTSDPLKLKDFQSELKLCPQKVMTSQKSLLDIFYKYKIMDFHQCKKNENQKIGTLFRINVTLFLPKKKQMVIERSLFFIYETN